MEDHFSKYEIDNLISSIRRGAPLHPPLRSKFAVTTKRLLKKAEVLTVTSQILAQQCAAQLAEYENAVDEQWVKDIAEEIEWWWVWTISKIQSGDIRLWKEFASKPFPFEKYVTEESKALRILNIGCGPRSTLGLKSKNRHLMVDNMDPLALAYNFIMNGLGVVIGEPIKFGAVEILRKLDIPYKYDFISAKNCLDHAYDVPKGLDELVSILDKKGVILLEHYENEAESQNYLGLHKWNIEIRNGRIHVWSKIIDEYFDHKSYGLKLRHEREIRNKGSGVPHPFVTIFLERL